ncbi:hypothetical protein QYE76_052335 [Lolium multiflorum]|uniref:FBD domain-containing protein n=1 Tax=Lolium multiflorum TaxID=4521 RepID=A0AAD8SV65_LOLMU|nr:hypothetical protein QYE76_052335 [Lolium multiflorum]
MHQLWVAAPALESFAYHGEILYRRDEDYETYPVEFIGKDNTRRTLSDAVTPELRDAYLSHLGLGGYDEVIHEFAYSGFLEEIAHARILTLCSVGLLHIEETRIFYELTMYTPNLEEVQLLMDTMSDGDVSRFCGFFGLTEPPLLERLFVRLPAAACEDTTEDTCSGTIATGEDADIVLDYEIALDHLTFIKVINFRGTTRELRLLRFLLRRAPVLEQLVLVIPEENEGTPGDHDQQKKLSLLLKIVKEHVTEIRKAWLWQDAHVSLCAGRGRTIAGALRTPTQLMPLHRAATLMAEKDGILRQAGAHASDLNALAGDSFGRLLAGTLKKLPSQLPSLKSVRTDSHLAIYELLLDAYSRTR